MTREHALDLARARFDGGSFRDRLASLVAIPSTAQEPAHLADCARYLEAGLRPWLERMGFVVAVHPNPAAGSPPILTAVRIEDPGLPTVLTYGHGDTVRGLDEQWSKGLAPWAVTERDGRWYGRGTADNKGQHALNLEALEAVLEARGGRLGFNLKLVIEMAEELGSPGLRDFVGAQRELLAADVLIGSDGPRVAPDTPSIKTGTRGTWHFDLVCRLRPGGVHSGHWGGVTKDPALRLAHALASIVDRNGRILVPGLLPKGQRLEPWLRELMAGCPSSGGGEDSATVDEGWGEPGLSTAEKIYAWSSFIVLAMLSGRPEAPVNAVAPWASAHCQLRFTVDADQRQFGASLRRHLDEQGFTDLVIENERGRMEASRTDPRHPWVQYVAGSIERSLGRRPQIVPNSSGGLPGDVFVDHLGTPLVWVPHSYNGCKQHGPDEHVLPGVMREGIELMAGLWWDLGEGGAPGRSEGAPRAG